MFRFFPIAVAARFHVDEQAFIFAPKFRVQVAQPARADQRRRNPRRTREVGGLGLRLTRLRALRVNRKFLNPFKLICPVQSRAKKESPSRETQISPRTPAIPARKRGVSRSSRTLDRAAMDAKAPGARCGSQGGFSRERS
jgi:hypothetical protein